MAARLIHISYKVVNLKLCETEAALLRTVPLLSAGAGNVFLCHTGVRKRLKSSPCTCKNVTQILLTTIQAYVTIRTPFQYKEIQ